VTTGGRGEPAGGPVDGGDLPVEILIDLPGARGRRGLSAGQIGAGFLSRFVLCIDPARQTMGLGDPRTVRIDPASAPGTPSVTRVRNAA
jgi:hypothetical protein